MNLEALRTTTTVEFDPDIEQDEVILDAEPASVPARARVITHLDRIRTRANLTSHARVTSDNNFPQSGGLASSASAFAALTLAAAAAAGLDLPERELSILARQGSGSAARSIPPGFVEWIAAQSSADSFARSIAPPSHWDLRDVIAIVTHEPKQVSSSDGHLRALSSPLLGERLNRLPARFHRLRRAILTRDLAVLGEGLELEALELHCIAMTSRPPILYWLPATLRVMLAAAAWRKEGLPAYFTLDAGANVHLICPADSAFQVADRVRNLAEVQNVIVSEPGGGSRLVSA